eukprot:8177094-Pyramimonas_sp.AAC.1
MRRRPACSKPRGPVGVVGCWSASAASWCSSCSRSSSYCPRSSVASHPGRRVALLQGLDGRLVLGGLHLASGDIPLVRVFGRAALSQLCRATPNLAGA